VLPKPVTKESKEIIKDLIVRCSKSKSKEAKELVDLLSTPHFKSLIECHDEVARISENPKPVKTDISKLFPELNGMTGETFRMVGVRKKNGEPLGLTVSVFSRLFITSKKRTCRCKWMTTRIW
jgi:hypothetical protein